MTGLLRSEVRKITSTKMWWILGLSSVAFVLLNVMLPFLLSGEVERQTGQPAFATSADVTNAIAGGGAAGVFVLILGILGMTTEYRHMTITSTFLVTPHRGRVLIAKAVVYALLGAVFAAVMFAIALAGTTIGLSLLSGEHAGLDWPTTWQVLGGMVLGFAIYAVVGVSVGALLRNQVAAVVVALAWVLLVEPILSIIPAIEAAGKYLPGSALNAVLQVTNTSGFGSTEVLSVGAGALVLLAYGVVFGALASLTTLRRDIT